MVHCNSSSLLPSTILKTISENAYVARSQFATKTSGLHGGPFSRRSLNSTDIETIAGVSGNARLISIVLLQSRTLVDYRTHMFSGPWTLQKEKAMLAKVVRCLQKHRVNRLAAVFPPLRPRQDIAHLMKLIVSKCKELNIDAVSYERADLNVLSTTFPHSKKDLIDNLVKLYPELEILKRKEERNSGKYYYKLFEAAAAATLLSRDIYPRSAR
jgi:hypothetical protein